MRRTHLISVSQFSVYYVGKIIGINIESLENVAGKLCFNRS
jgi:hypothetical protein